MFERLISLVRQEKVSLFIGSGFSLEAGAPSVSKLKDAILSKFESQEQREKYEDKDLASVADYFVNTVCLGSRNSLNEILREQFSYTSKDAPDHIALAKIPHFHTIFTTNYDAELERAYPKEDFQVVRNDKDCTLIDEKRPVTIFKIHGDLLNPETILITKKDYKCFFKSQQNRELWNCVKTEFLKKNILFIGYSLKDKNILDIIKNISISVNDSQKEMFLIAPNIDRATQGRLKKMHVHYFDCYAKVFLNELTKSLSENVSTDYRHHKISPETFTRYCNLHNIKPTISLNIQRDKDNEILNVKSLNKEPLQYKLSFETNEKFKSMIESHNFEKDGKFYPLNDFSNIPLIRLAGKDLLKGSLSVNGMVMRDDISEIFIGPAINNCFLTISIPSRNFLEMVKAKIFSPQTGKVVYDIDTEVYSASISLSELKKSKAFNMKFNFKMKEHFTDLDKAIKWIDFPDALFSKENFQIKEIVNRMLNASEATKQPIEHNFHQVKEYLNNIKKIEIITGNKFDVYNECTEQSWKMSKVILYSLEQKPVSISCPNGLNFPYVTKTKPSFLSANNECTGICIVRTDGQGAHFVFNDREFKFSYIHKIFISCDVKLESQSSNSYKLAINFHGNTYLQLYSNALAKNIYPSLMTL